MRAVRSISILSVVICLFACLLTANASKLVQAHLSGKILEIHVGAGEAVSPGQKLVTIEWGNMKSSWTSPSGQYTVAEILVKIDDHVEVGDTLIVLEEAK